MRVADEVVQALVDDYSVAPLEPRRLVMLRYAAQLTRAPGSIDRSSVDSLREHGFSDRDVLDIVEVTAYYAYANRVADGLGVELEEEV